MLTQKVITAALVTAVIKASAKSAPTAMAIVTLSEFT